MNAIVTAQRCEIFTVNLNIQTVKDVGLFPTAYAQDDVQQVQKCGWDSGIAWVWSCAYVYDGEVKDYN